MTNGDQVHQGTGEDDFEDDHVEETLRRAASVKEHLAQERVDRQLEQHVERRSSPSSRTDWRSLAKRSFSLLAIGAGLAAGIAQLSFVRLGNVSRLLLIGIFLSTLLYLVIRVWTFYYVEKVRDLRRQLQTNSDLLAYTRSQHQRVRDAIERINDRERFLFVETLEITVWIGHDDESDFVEERRVTKPDSIFTQRTARPIIPNFAEKVARQSEIEFKTHRDNGSITAIPLREQINLLKVWLIFDPALTTPTEWSMSYRPHGLWRPLRERGWDELAWDDRSVAGDGAPTALQDLTVRFKFAASNRRPGVRERHGYGEVSEPTLTPDGNWEVVWQDARPAGRRYVWELNQPPS